MKIAIATPTLGFQGGLERYAQAYAETFRRLGHVVTLLHAGRAGRQPEVYASSFDRVGKLDNRALVSDQDVVYAQRAYALDDLRAFAPVPVVVAAHDHDHTCVRSHRYLPLGSTPCHRTPGIGCIVRGCAIVRSREGFPVALRNPMRLARETRELGRAAPIVACSRYVADRIVDAGVEHDRVHAVHPILPRDLRPTVPRPDAARLLVMGQLLKGKGFDLAIDALAHLPSDHVLTIVGDGPSRAELEAQAARVAPGRVIFAGYVPPERVFEAYDAASVVIVPSRWPEPFGLIGVEAMQRGRPVVAVAHGGIPEWLTDGRGGELVPPLDVAALAAAVARLVGDRDAGERALAAGLEFDHDASALRVLELLRSTADASA